tara:strand:- start:3015 stop:3767 length:753 start_codon:yes stop_codon:yes gene_type:complete
LFGFKRNIKKEKYFISWQDNKVKLTVHHENRKDSRVSLTKSGVNIRLPILLPEFEKKRLIGKFIDWAKERLDEKPYFHYDKYKKYKDQDQLTLYDSIYTLHLSKSGLGKNKGRLTGSDIKLALIEQIDQEVYDKTVSHMIYKLLAKKYKPILWDWLCQLNAKHAFGELKSMRVKNNSSNWGSCSNRGNINISIRLLLAPKEVIEYVLIHELSHLSEQNHGSNFWSRVEQACPNYRKSEKWLKTHAKSCVI